MAFADKGPLFFPLVEEDEAWERVYRQAPDGSDSEFFVIVPTPEHTLRAMELDSASSADGCLEALDR